MVDEKVDCVGAKIEGRTRKHTGKAPATLNAAEGRKCREKRRVSLVAPMMFQRLEGVP